MQTLLATGTFKVIIWVKLSPIIFDDVLTGRKSGFLFLNPL